jgi:hypothetical protein
MPLLTEADSGAAIRNRKKEIQMSNKLLLMVRPLVISSVLASAASNTTITPATPVASPTQAHPDSPLPDCFPCNHA